MLVFTIVLVGSDVLASDFSPTSPCAAELRLSCTVGCPSALRTLVERLAPAGTRVKWTTLFDLRSKNPGPSVSAVRDLDGILSPGGKDIPFEEYSDAIPKEHRVRYRAAYDRTRKRVLPDASGYSRSDARNAAEIPFWRDYFREAEYARLPALGICYGHQALAVAYGYGLVTDLPLISEIPARYGKPDLLSFRGGANPLADVPPNYEFRGMEQHHQSVDFPGGRTRGSLEKSLEGSNIFATSNGGIVIEGIVYRDRPAYGIQFHPEETADPVVRRAAIAPFLRAACARSLERARELDAR